MSLSVGIDLASQDKRTAICVMSWTSSGGAIELLEPVASDEILLAACRELGVQKVAIDAPFGWPDAFVRAISAHHNELTFPVGTGDGELRKPFVFRETDRYVIDVAKKRPLSVSTDKIAYPALRCAGLLHELREADGRPVDRTGAGLLAEVYPGAALNIWSKTWLTGLIAGYKGKTDAHSGQRKRLAAVIFDAAHVRDVGALAKCEASDDALDAVICALLARLIACGQTRPLPPQHREIAMREGWIHLPLDGEPDFMPRRR